MTGNDNHSRPIVPQNDNYLCKLGQLFTWYICSSRNYLSFRMSYLQRILRDYYMTFSISALVLARDSHIKPNSEAGELIWVKGWYQEPYGKFHVIIFSSHILHLPFPSIDFNIAKKIYEQTNCENKSLRELPLFNLQIFLFRIWFQNYTKQCRSVQWR
jgi:hypothetical protein